METGNEGVCDEGGFLADSGDKWPDRVALTKHVRAVDLSMRFGEE
jgi:hypothetical protein